MSLLAHQAMDDSWKALLTPGAPLAFGLDPATTENEKSNPTGFAVVQKVGNEFITRLAARWKTADPAVTIAIIEDALKLPKTLHPRRLVVDASSERYFAADLRRRLRGKVMVELMSSTQKVTYRGEEMPAKVYLGNQVINLLEDGQLILPSSKWLERDFRLVKRDRGSFTTEVDTNGGHGDVFDAVKLAIHGVGAKGGPAEIAAVNAGLRMAVPSGRNDFPMRPEDVDDSPTFERISL